jgi:hypothetical protein
MYGLAQDRTNSGRGADTKLHSYILHWRASWAQRIQYCTGQMRVQDRVSLDSPYSSTGDSFPV